MTRFAPERVFGALQAAGADYVTVVRERAMIVPLGEVDIIVASRSDLIRLKAGSGRAAGATCSTSATCSHWTSSPSAWTQLSARATGRREPTP